MSPKKERRLGMKEKLCRIFGSTSQGHASNATPRCKWHPNIFAFLT